MSGVENVEHSTPETGLDGLEERLVEQLVSRAKSGGLKLTGEGGVLQQLTKRLLESALDGEITDHLGYDKHAPAGRGTGNSRNGTRAKTVLTDVGLDEPGHHPAVRRDRPVRVKPWIRCRHRPGVQEQAAQRSVVVLLGVALDESAVATGDFGQGAAAIAIAIAGEEAGDAELAPSEAVDAVEDEGSVGGAVADAPFPSRRGSARGGQPVRQLSAIPGTTLADEPHTQRHCLLHPSRMERSRGGSRCL
ncbi:transposase [Actinophytocola sp. NPDC049390]|uniref:transposase n=1 Tax=Actinophytocola sp. NPDC049390 TaxID=3363894 RepID=UPI003791046F